MPESAQFSGKDQKLALALARGASKVDAAALSGYAVRTVWNKLRNRVFVDYVARLRRDMVDGAVGKLSALTSAAVVVLANLLKDEDSAIRLRAAQTILEQYARLKDSVELEARLVELEGIVAHGRNPGSYPPPRIANRRDG